MLQQTVSILSFAAIGLSAFGLGRPVLRALRLDADDALSICVWSLGIGLVVSATLLAGMGLVGLLYAPLIGVLSALAGFWGLGELLNDYVSRCERNLAPVVRRPSAPEPPSAPFAPPPRWLLAALYTMAGLACLGSLVGALAPTTDGDALCYHLELPKAFLASHRLEFLPDSENSTFPLLVEMWYLWALAIDGGVAAQLIHWGMGVLLAMAAIVLATPIVGRPWARVAGPVVLLVPAVSNQMTAPLNDVALAFYCTLTLAAWWRSGVDLESRRWFILSGLCAGGALGTKYLAILFFAAVSVAIAWTAWRHGDRRRLLLTGAAAAMIVAVSVSGLWYVRAAWHRGNPVYPFFSEALHGRTAAVQQKPTFRDSKLPLGRRPISVLTGTWKITMHPERYGGRGHQLGPLFLALAPGLLLVRRLRGLGLLMAIAGVYWVLWFLLRQNVRFLLPLVPMLSVVALWILIEMHRLPLATRRIAAAAVAVVLLASCGAALARCRDCLGVACGLESRSEFLTRKEPTWLAANASNQLSSGDDHILSQDQRAFYFNCRVTRENLYRLRTRYQWEIGDPLDFSRELRRAGFTHLLLAENRGTSGVTYDPTLSRLAEAQWAAGGGDSLVKIADYEFTDADGAIRRYRLVMLQ
ncbi:MAG: phospholipid carrier-dependent glycosyltransferase [Pirellulales bacterium]|nr:phospholipid carrier-dependent glycosyltransferase [Pirellulales bacterium]